MCYVPLSCSTSTMLSHTRDIISLTQLVELRANELPDQIAYYTGIDEPGSPLRSLTYSQLMRAVNRLCHNYTAEGLTLEDSENNVSADRVVAVLTTSAIDLTLLQVALVRLGKCPFLLSVNNSVPAIAHLCKTTNATHLIFGERYAAEAKEVQLGLKKEGYHLVLVEEKRPPLWGEQGVDATEIPPFAPKFPPQQEYLRTAVILHSSGSTGFPRPVFITHKGLVANLKITSPAATFCALPVYHSFGHFSGFRCIYHTRPFTLFPPHLPLTAANLCRLIQTSPAPCEQCVAVPYIIKLLGESEEGTHALAKFNVVSYSGASVPDDLGDRLTKAGVNLLSHYGSTETGGLLSSNRDFNHDKAWNWLRKLDSAKDYIEFEERDAGIYELVVKDGYSAKIESNRPDGSYATKDLFVMHCDRDDWVKYMGRLDDTIVQLLGEKTNPVPIELAIRGNSPYVAEAIVFGIGRPQIGCLILPSELGQGLSEDRDALIDKIWPAVESANAEAPSHSKLLPEMIDILPYGTEVPVASKMSILRPTCYAKFKDIIDGIYERCERGSREYKLNLNMPELEHFLDDVFVHVLGPDKAKDLNRTVNLFTFGVDSLQSTQVRNICQTQLDLGGQQLGQNVVYEHPSIERLAEHIIAIRSGYDAPSLNNSQVLMTSMVEQWCGRLLKPSMSLSRENGNGTIQHPHIVVLTGATGFLGAHILHQLVSSAAVSQVICLVRASTHDAAFDRVQSSLRSRRLTLSPEEICKIRTFAADINQEDLGIGVEEYEGIRSSVTIVIHNAWPVNFLIGVESFDEHIGSVVNLINLCLRSNTPLHTRFFFSSSIATQSASSGIIPETFSQSPSTAQQTGYGQSKWVAEQICQRAASLDAVCIGVLRIGQLVGDTQNGVWNETEAWPLMFKSVEVTETLPRLDEDLSWLPVDVAARAITEIATQTKPSQRFIYHIVSPQLTKWEVVLAGLRLAGLEFEIVDNGTWLRSLEESDAPPDRNPAMKLLPYFRGRMGGDSPRKHQQFSVENSALLSKSIANCDAVSEDLVRKWVDTWRRTGFLAS